MRIEKHPYNYLIKKRFTETRLLAGFEGGSVRLADQDGAFYVILDEGTMADFLIPGEDDDLLNEMIKIYAFDTEQEREQFIQNQGWNTPGK